MVSETVGPLRFNLVIEILIVDRDSFGEKLSGYDKFQSRNRDSYS